MKAETILSTCCALFIATLAVGTYYEAGVANYERAQQWAGMPAVAPMPYIENVSIGCYSKEQLECLTMEELQAIPPTIDSAIIPCRLAWADGQCWTHEELEQLDDLQRRVWEEMIESGVWRES